MRENQNKGIKQQEKKMRSTADHMTTTGCALQIRKIISLSSGSPQKCKINDQACEAALNCTHKNTNQCSLKAVIFSFM